MKVAQISRGDITGAIVTLRSRPAFRSTPSGPKVTDAKLSPATVNRYMASLSSVLQLRADHEIIEAHPMKGGKVRKLAESNGRTRILTPTRKSRLMEAARASSWPMLALFVRTCMTTAARRAEVLNLRWQDVRLDESIACSARRRMGARAPCLLSRT
jgi:integrase